MVSILSFLKIVLLIVPINLLFGGPEVSYHQTYSVSDWLSILRTLYPTQNLQRKHRTEKAMACETNNI
jgi:hypothetical protein